MRKHKCEQYNMITGYDMGRCGDCGMVKTDMDKSWGLSRDKWFNSREEAELYKSTGRLAQSTQDKVLMPKELTAANGGKSLMIGEFYENIEMQHPDFCGCGICPDCTDGDGMVETYMQRVPVSWDTIKEIYAKAVNHFGDEE